MKSRMIPFGEVMELAPRELVGESNLPVMSITMRDGLIDQEEKFKKRIASSDISTYKVVRFGNLVVGFPIDEGVLGFQQRYDAAAVSPAYDIWQLTGQHDVDRSYFERVLRSDWAREIYATKMRGTTSRRRTIPKEIFRQIEFPLPPLPEQKRIAAILDAADALRARRRTALAELDALLQSTFLDMFGDPVTNPMGWEEHHFSTLAGNSFRNGLSPSTKGDLTGEVLTLSAITGGRFDFTCKKLATFDKEPTSNQRVTKGTFLICRGNGNKSLVGIGAYSDRSDDSVCFPDTMIGVNVDLDIVTLPYLHFVWNSNHVRMQLEQGARTTNGTFKVNQQLLRTIQIPLPPLNLQCRFATIVESVEQQKDRMNAHQTELDSLFASLQSRAFNGEL